MMGLKKIIYKFLCNSFFGKLILLCFKQKVPDIRWPGFKFSFQGAKTDLSIVASVFWGFYESSEIRFAEQYFKGSQDVLELGGSSGIVSAHLVSKLKPGKRLVSVEANQNLSKAWTENTSRVNYYAAELILVNKAIHYGAEVVSFHVSDNTTASSAVTGNIGNGPYVEIKTTTVNTLQKQFNLLDYLLVCDIEGAEVEILVNESDSLDACSAILIELHPSCYNGVDYNEAELEALILKKGFVRRDSYGPVYYFEK